MSNEKNKNRKNKPQRRRSQQLYAFPAHINYGPLLESLAREEGLDLEGKSGMIRKLIYEGLHSRGIKFHRDEEGLLYPDISKLKK